MIRYLTLVIVCIFLGVFIFIKVHGIKFFQSELKNTSSLTNSSRVFSLTVSVTPFVKQVISFTPPFDLVKGRVTKKPFGIYVSPQNSPVFPEKFTGFHAGVDFETFSNEQNAQIKVKAICGGKLVLKEWVSGYGGVAIQSCKLNDSPVTVLYGHLNLLSVSGRVGDFLKQGNVIGELGKGYSSQTDQERKHLHLSIHKGNEIDLKGYVSSKDALSSWINPCEYVCR